MRATVLTLLTTALLATLPAAASAEIVRLTVVHTNDIHGGIDPSSATFMNRDFPPRLGGGASMITVVERLREETSRQGGHFVLLDAGDIFQGTPVGTVTQGRAVIDFMNRARYDALAIGNHDFDEGKENCWELVRRAQFPVLAANLVDKATGDLPEGLEPWIIKDFGNLRIGIFGLITPETVSMSFPAHIEGLDFLPMTPVARRCVAELEEQGCDLIFGVGHVGVPYDPDEAMEDRQEYGFRSEDDPSATVMDVTHQVPGIDAFFGGHIHKGHDRPFSMPDTHTLLFQTYGRGSGAGIVTFSVDTETDQIISYDLWTERGYLVTFFEEEFWPDRDTKSAILQEVAAAEFGMDTVIGRAPTVITRQGDGESPLGNAVCDAMLQETGADFAFTNLGGVREDLGPGDITPRDVFQVLPFGNKMIVVEMSGRLLRQVVEKRIENERSGLYLSGGRVVYNKTRENFDRVVSFDIGGEMWDPDATYQVATSDYLLQGNAGLTMLPDVPEELLTFTGKTMRQALEAWVKRNSPLNVDIDGRMTRDDTAEPSDEFAAATIRGRATP